MAKVKGPLLSQVASGTIMDKISFRTTKRGSIVTPYHYPGKRNPSAPSFIQVERRDAFSAAVATWNALSAADKEQYNAAGSAVNLTGWNLYLREQLNNIGASGQPLPGINVSDTSALGQSVTLSYLFNGTGNTILDSSGFGRNSQFLGAQAIRRVSTPRGFVLDNSGGGTDHVSGPILPTSEYLSGFSVFTVINNPGLLVPDSTPQVIFSLGEQPQSPVTIYKSAGGVINFLVRTSGGNITASASNGITLGQDDEWHYMFFRYEPPVLHINYWRNGISGYESASIPGTLNAVTGPLTIAGDPLEYPWDGQISIVQSFNRVITDQEILDLIDNQWAAF